MQLEVTMPIRYSMILSLALICGCATPAQNNVLSHGIKHVVVDSWIEAERGVTTPVPERQCKGKSALELEKCARRAHQEKQRQPSGL